jgi:uncharacterized protein (TIGR01777 family)
MRAVVTGGTGFIGRALCARLPAPVVLTRSPGKAPEGLEHARFVAWDPTTGPPPPEALEGADVVFNLAGAPIADGRWTEAKRKQILESRVVTTRNLVAGIGALSNWPRVLVSGSAVGFYGDRGDETLDEHARGGDDFLARVCRDWEREAEVARGLGLRVVTVRTGLVLGDGGALEKMLPPFKLGLGGPIAGGRQWMPWIHLDDQVGLLLHAATCDDLDGPLNACAPNAVTNADFTRALGDAVHRPTVIPLPGFALRTALGEMSTVLTASQRAVPRRAEETGYAFEHPTLAGALEQVVSEQR